MDRLSRRLAACGLGLLTLAAGCKSVPEVPPGRRIGTPPAAPVGASLPGVDFGSDPRPNQAQGFMDGAPGSNPRMGGGGGSSGVLPAGLNPYDAPAAAPAKSYSPNAFPGDSNPDPMSGRPFSMGQPGDR